MWQHNGIRIADGYIKKMDGNVTGAQMASGMYSLVMEISSAGAMMPFVVKETASTMCYPACVNCQYDQAFTGCEGKGGMRFKEGIVNRGRCSSSICENGAITKKKSCPPMFKSFPAKMPGGPDLPTESCFFMSPVSVPQCDAADMCPKESHLASLGMKEMSQLKDYFKNMPSYKKKCYWFGSCCGGKDDSMPKCKAGECQAIVNGEVGCMKCDAKCSFMCQTCDSDPPSVSKLQKMGGCIYKLKNYKPGQVIEYNAAMCMQVTCSMKSTIDSYYIKDCCEVNGKIVPPGWNKLGREYDAKRDTYTCSAYTCSNITNSIEPIPVNCSCWYTADIETYHGEAAESQLIKAPCSTLTCNNGKFESRPAKCEAPCLDLMPDKCPTFGKNTCENAKSYMELNCRKYCGFCKGSTGGQTGGGSGSGKSCTNAGGTFYDGEVIKTEEYVYPCYTETCNDGAVKKETVMCKGCMNGKAQVQNGDIISTKNKCPGACYTMKCVAGQPVKSTMSCAGCCDKDFPYTTFKFNQWIGKAKRYKNGRRTSCKRKRCKNCNGNYQVILQQISMNNKICKRAPFAG